MSNLTVNNIVKIYAVELTNINPNAEIGKRLTTEPHLIIEFFKSEKHTVDLTKSAFEEIVLIGNKLLNK